jgi:hypothetical protein
VPTLDKIVAGKPAQPAPVKPTETPFDAKLIEVVAIAAGPGAGILVFRPDILGKFFQIKFKLQPGGRLGVKPGPLFPLNFAPQPIGLVPPKLVGLPPDYAGRVIPASPESRFLQTLPPGDPAVARYYAQREEKFKDFYNATGYPQLSPPASLRKSVPEKLVDLLAEGRERAAHFLSHQLTGPHPELPGGITHGATVAPAVPHPLTTLLSAAVAMGSSQPEQVAPVSDKALRNEAAAEGVNKMLAINRADP